MSSYLWSLASDHNNSFLPLVHFRIFIVALQMIFILPTEISKLLRIEIVSKKFADKLVNPGYENLLGVLIEILL